MGSVTTFYSYKGGSGRSMSMANVAWALATNGSRVLTIDWDLEAPGLHRYFHPFLSDPDQESSDGLIDRIWDYVEFASGITSNNKRAFDGRLSKLADLRTLAQPLDLPLRGKGCLHFIGAGRQDSKYSEKVRGLDWQHFYDAFGGEYFISKFIQQAREHYDYILIDSRTGVADTAGICTIQIPDHVVMCFVYNRQSIEGTVAIAKSIRETRKWASEGQTGFTLVPSRVEERAQVDAARKFAADRFASIFSSSRSAFEATLRRNEIRHYPWCAFEEKLAVFEDTPEERGSLLDMMNELAAKVAGKKTLKIANIDRNVLDNFWRKASFEDPRIAELQSIKIGSSDTAVDRLLMWASETAADDTASTDWLMALAEAIFEFTNGADDRIPLQLTDYLGEGALTFASRSYKADPEEYRPGYVQALRHRAIQLSRMTRHDSARKLLEEALSLMGPRKDVLSRWRYAGLMEVRAELLEASDGLPDAISAYHDAVTSYEDIKDILPLRFGAGPMRAKRVLAEKLFTLERYMQAELVSVRAFEQLMKMDLHFANRYPSEALKTVSIRAECIAAMGFSQTSSFDELRSTVKRSFVGPLTKAAEQKIWLAEARLQLREAGPQIALNTILNALGDDSPLPEVLRFAALVITRLQDAGISPVPDHVAASVLHAVPRDTYSRLMDLVENNRALKPELRIPPERIGLDFAFGTSARVAPHYGAYPLVSGNDLSFVRSHILNTPAILDD